jgi:hypothetical protein
MYLSYVLYVLGTNSLNDLGINDPLHIDNKSLFFIRLPSNVCN